jgi:flavodoxin
MASLKSLVVVYSYHHKNTEKVAGVIANVLKAEVKHPQDINAEEIEKYNLVGFGAGIDSGKHYKPILEFAEALSTVKDKKAFIFSTSGVAGQVAAKVNHTRLREILLSKGYTVVDEFNCKGFNTNSILKYFGGMNKRRPNTEDLKEAEIFAKKLEQYNE